MFEPVTMERCATLEEVAEQFGLKPRYLRQLVKERGIPVLLPSSRLIRFDRIAFEALKKTLRPEEEPAPPALLEIEPPPRAKALDGWVYFIQSGNEGPIKIGTALDARQRLKVLQTAHPGLLRLVGYTLGGRAVEQRLLREYRDLQISGEWHTPAPELIQFIKACAHGRAGHG